MLRYLKCYLATGLTYNTGLLLFSKIDRQDEHFKEYPYFYYQKIFHLSIFRTLLFPYSLYEYGMYPSTRSLTYPPIQPNMRNLYRLECLINVEEDLQMKECFLHLYLIEQKKIYG